jgi:hypothetical protein
VRKEGRERGREEEREGGRETGKKSKACKPAVYLRVLVGDLRCPP